MLKYTLKRLVNAVVVLFVITTATWFLMQLLPGSPIQNAEKLTPEQEAQVAEQYNLDKPLPVQYALYMTGLLRGDFGTSYQYGGRPVNSIILERLPVSIFLGTQAIIVGLVVGLFLGIVSALKQNSIWDSGAAFLAVLGVSIPDFVLAPLAQYWLGLKLGIFPIAFFESWWHSVLPSLVLSTVIAAVIATFTRTEMLEVLGQDYVTLAKAKGLSRLAVILKHVLRNSMIPLVTIMLPLTAALVTGTLIVETVFSIPGLGEQFVRSIFEKDFPVIMGTTILYSVFFVASDLFEPVQRSPEDVEKITGPPTGFWGDAWRRLKRNRIAIVAGCIIILVLVLAVAGPWLTPYTSVGQMLDRQYKTPSLSGYWFGTDEFGRSMFDRVWVGTRVSLYIAALVTAMDLFVGMSFGAISGYYGGRVDNIMQRVVEILSGIPILIVAVLTLLIFSPGILSLAIAIGLTGWTSSARLIRGQVLRLKEQEFFLASRSLGANTFRLISKHLIPNVFYILIITLMYTVPTAVFFEAFLSFIGLGIQPPAASLGALINDGADEMRFYPYMLIFPAAVLVTITISFRLLGDGLRDALDPRMRK